MSDLGFRRVVRTGLAPLVEEAPEGPSWADVASTPVVGDADRRLRFAPWLVGVGSAILVLTVIGVAAWLGGNNSLPPIGTPTTSGAVVGFRPPLRTVNGETWLDLTLLDGSQVTLGYPSDLDLTSQGVEVQTVGSLAGANSRVFGAYYGTTESFISATETNSGRGELVASYPGFDGGVVQRWEFPEEPIAYLVYDFDPWTVFVWDGMGGGELPMRVAAEAEWSKGLRGSVDDRGFLVLSADEPLELVPAAADPGPDGPDIRVDGTSGSLLVFINDCNRMTRLDEEAYGKEVFAFCDEPTNTLFFVSGTAEVQQRVHETLRVNPEEPTATTMVPPTTTTTPEVQLPDSGPIFGEETGVLLLLDDGLEGLIAVYPDGRKAARSPVEGQRPGDEPYSMVKVGNHLVVGWGEIYSVDINSRSSFSLGEATIFVPSASGDSVWLIDYPGGRIGNGPKTVWQVTTEGETVTEPTLLHSDLHPQYGVPGGLALQSDSGLDLWDASSGQLRHLDAHGPGFVEDVHGPNLLWSASTRQSLMLTDTNTLETTTFDMPESQTADSAAFSDDGTLIAVALSTGTTTKGVLLVIDLQTGVQTLVGTTDPTVRPSYVAWAPDNDQIFVTGYSYGASFTRISRYQVSDGEFSTVVVPVGGGITPVVVDRSVIDRYFLPSSERTDF